MTFCFNDNIHPLFFTPASFLRHQIVILYFRTTIETWFFSRDKSLSHIFLFFHFVSPSLIVGNKFSSRIAGNNCPYEITKRIKNLCRVCAGAFNNWCEPPDPLDHPLAKLSPFPAAKKPQTSPYGFIAVLFTCSFFCPILQIHFIYQIR